MSAHFLEVQNITKSYYKQPVLHGVSFNVPQGTIFGLLGPNGAGKTSLIRIITRILAPDSGTITLNGMPLADISKRTIGYLPEERGLYKKMTVGAHLQYLARLNGLSVSECNQQLTYWSEAFDISSWFSKPIETLSKGMQQKVQFIAAVLHQPKLLILDEPFTGFDPVNTKQLIKQVELLKKQGVTILFSTHRMETAEELCDEIALIHKGNVVLTGSIHAVKRQYHSGHVELETQHTLNGIPEPMHLLEVSQTPYHTFKHLIACNQTSVNTLLAHAISQTEVIGFKEKLPTLDDIFIQATT